MNEQKVRNEVEKLTKDNPQRQYPANKTQSARLAELGLTEMMPQRFIGGGRYGIGNLDAQKVISAAEDAGGLSGGWTSYGDGDVVRVGASALYEALHGEAEEESEDATEIASYEVEPDVFYVIYKTSRGYEVHVEAFCDGWQGYSDGPVSVFNHEPNADELRALHQALNEQDDTLDELIDKVTATEAEEEERRNADEARRSEMWPLAHFGSLANPDTLRRAAWQGRLRAEKIGRDWFTDEDAVRAYLKRARRSRRVEQPVTFVNLTPHAITVRRQDGTELNIPRSGQVARCEERRTPCGTVDGIAVTTASYGAVDGLPEPQHGTFYIVSGLVLAAVGDRRADVLAPGPAIRDGEGRIIACDGLSAGPAFAGRR